MRLAQLAVSSAVQSQAVVACGRKGALSKLRHAELSGLRSFSYSQLAVDLQGALPILYKLLLGLVSRTDARETTNRTHAVVCTALASLLRERSQRTSGVALLVALCMLGNNCSSKAFDFLHAIGLCLGLKQVRNIQKEHLAGCKLELKALCTQPNALRSLQFVIDNINIHRVVAGAGVMFNFTVGFVTVVIRINPGLPFDRPFCSREDFNTSTLLPGGRD
jgi:hypothetical protein